MFTTALNKLCPLITAMFVLLVVACGGNDDETSPSLTAGGPFPVTIDRSDGEQLTIEAQPQRIASLSPAATEILYAIGAGPQIAAVDNFSNYPPEATSKPKLDSFQPSVEAIVAAQPDLVFIFFDSAGIVGKLDDLGTPVLYLTAPNSVDGILQQIHTLGEATGHEAEAEALVRQMQGRIDSIESKLSGISQRPRVFHELDPTLFTVTPRDFVGDLYETLRAQNIGADAAIAAPQLSAEAVIERNPQVIVLADEAAGVTAESVKSRPGWSQIEAVQTNRIHAVDPAIVSRPGPRIVDAMETLAELLYPELFP